jgi:hypothetical protein
MFFLLIFSTNVLSYDKGVALSGGVSLGSYEAGVLYSLIAENRDELPKEMKVVYGASAGSINGLLGIFDLCGFRISSRESNLLWKMWVPIGLDQLETKDKKISSLFDRKSIAPLFNELRERWIEGFKETCDLHFGVAVTRKEPLVDELKPGLDIVRQPEFFSVRIRGRGPGKFPIVENSVHQNIKTYRTYLPVGESPEKDIEILLDLIQASSAFPGAFDPYDIKFCFLKPGEKFRGCKSESTQKEQFIDGGIYHNGPVGYAYETLLKSSKDKNFELYYINASSPLQVHKEVIKKKSLAPQGVFKDFSNLFYNFMMQARIFELGKSLESNPELESHLKTNQKHYPLVSEPLYAFLGFVETDFRKSDFYLGIYDGEESNVKKLDHKDLEYSCFRERLRENSNCQIEHNLELLINLAKYRVKKNQTEPDFYDVFNYLEENEFVFRDLGLKRSEARYGRINLKKRLSKLLKGFAERQPEKEHGKLNYFIRPSLNYLHYTPPDSFWYANYGTSPEIGYSRIIHERYFSTASFRYNLTGMLNGFSSLYSRAQDIVAFTPMVGLEYEPLWLNSAMWQWHLGARAGYILAPKDNFGTDPCDAEISDESSAACSGVTAHLFLAFSILESLRLQFVYVPFVVDSFSLDAKPEIILQVGFQFGESF